MPAVPRTGPLSLRVDGRHATSDPLHLAVRQASHRVRAGVRDSVSAVRPRHDSRARADRRGRMDLRAKRARRVGDDRGRSWRGGRGTLAARRSRPRDQRLAAARPRPRLGVLHGPPPRRSVPDAHRARRSGDRTVAPGTRGPRRSPAVVRADSAPPHLVLVLRQRPRRGTTPAGSPPMRRCQRS